MSDLQDFRSIPQRTAPAGSYAETHCHSSGLFVKAAGWRNSKLFVEHCNLMTRQAARRSCLNKFSSLLMNFVQVVVTALFKRAAGCRSSSPWWQHRPA